MGKIGRRIPDWIKFKIPSGSAYTRIKSVINNRQLNTICLEARCPNIGECFCRGTATFLILGRVCSRNCKYCSVATGIPEKPDPLEPEKIADAVSRLGLSYAVITSVTRDDLPDGGASAFAETLEKIRSNGACGVELLVPDFRNKGAEPLERILAESPDVLNHNIEVCRSRYADLRPQGHYDLSLELIHRVYRSGVPVKSGLMIGFGEGLKEIEATVKDLYSAGCRMLTIGQYLQSDRDGYPVKKYYRPEAFEEIRLAAVSAGIPNVYSGPQVRSSYRAEEMLKDFRGQRPAGKK